jgi:hypothetical protein
VPNCETLFIALDEDGVANVEPIEKVSSIEPRGLTCCVLRRLASSPETYIEVVTANDAQTIEFVPNPNGDWMARWHLFAEFLEKGVIRRARVHGALLPRANDTEIAIECCRAALQSPLPLTT